MGNLPMSECTIRAAGVRNAKNQFQQRIFSDSDRGFAPAMPTLPNSPSDTGWQPVPRKEHASALKTNYSHPGKLNDMDGTTSSDLIDPNRSWFMHAVVARVVVWGSAMVSLAIYAYVGRLFSIPSLHGYSTSLLEGSVFTNLLVVAVVYLAIVGIASILGGSFKPGLGVFAASFGLAAISWRGGMVSDLLRANSGNVYPMLLVETVLLAALVSCGAAAQALLTHKPPIEEVKEEEHRPTLVAKLTSVGTQAGVTAVLVYFLAASDSKGQALAAVGIASLIGTLVSDNALPVGMTPLAVVAPFVAAILGYAWATINTGGTVAPNPLANALPLDYASFGVAGTMLGHWMSQQWREESEME
jgi:hypothetical protein